MALSVATNVGALSATKAASAVNKSMETSMARLASGKRINSAADDSAGLAIASRLTAEARGLDMAARNAADAQAMLNTIESAHNEITNILQRMRELAVQGANDTTATKIATNIRLGADELKKKLTHCLPDQMGWQGPVSAAQTFKYQVGDEKDEALTVTTSSQRQWIECERHHIAALTDNGGFNTYIDTVNSAIATIASIPR